MKSKNDLFFLRAHLFWTGGGVIFLLFVGFRLSNLFFPEGGPQHWLLLLGVYFGGVFISINIWSAFEIAIDKKRYVDLIKHFDSVMFLGSYLKRLIVLRAQ